MSDPDPRIVRLAGEAEEAANYFDPLHGLTIWTDSSIQKVVVTITAELENQLVHTNCYLSLAQLDEVLRDLLAARADLVKLENTMDS